VCVSLHKKRVFVPTQAAIAILNAIYYFYWVGWPCIEAGAMDYGSGYESIPGSSSHGGIPSNDDYQPPVY